MNWKMWAGLAAVLWFLAWASGPESQAMIGAGVLWAGAPIATCLALNGVRIRANKNPHH